MAAAIGKYAANKVLKSQMKKYKGKKVESEYDPYFAMIPDPRRPGKLKKVKKQIPAYIPEHDADVLAAVRKSAYRLDMSLFNLFGMRFGWESVIGLIPAAGDVIGVAFALLLFRKACSVDGGLDATVKLRMLINILLDFVVGLVPFVGDLADAAFKCNTKNTRLLEEALDRKYKPDHLRADARDAARGEPADAKTKRKSGIYHPRDPPPATVFDDSSDEEELGRPAVGVRQPAPARTADSRAPPPPGAVPMTKKGARR